MAETWNETLTKTERAELRSLARRRAKVAKGDVDSRYHELLAEVEDQLATEFEAEDERWRNVVDDAQRAAVKANEHILAACKEHGIPTKFAPSIEFGWQSRGGNGMMHRRTELRKVAKARLEFMSRDAKSAIDRRTVEIETRLASTALQSAEASEWLASLPAVDDLLTALSIDDVRAELGTGD